MAFYFHEEIVMNFTIGWNGYLYLFLYTIISICFIYNTKLGNLLDTFCSLNANKNARPAGNLFFTSLSQSQRLSDQSSVSLLYKERKESSDIIRENTYDLFKKNFAYFFKEEFSEDNN
jgi:hypothetical protein